MSGVFDIFSKTVTWAAKEVIGYNCVARGRKEVHDGQTE